MCVILPQISELFRRHLNVGGMPRRYFFELLAFFAKADHEVVPLRKLNVARELHRSFHSFTLLSVPFALLPVGVLSCVIMSHIASIAYQAEKLREMASAAGQEELYAYCNRMRRTCIEVLQVGGWMGWGGGCVYLARTCAAHGACASHPCGGPGRRLCVYMRVLVYMCLHVFAFVRLFACVCIFAMCVYACAYVYGGCDTCDLVAD